MAIQTNDGITSPDQNDPFDYANQLATLAETTQLALNKRANSYVGTSAQRESVRTVLSEGSHWTDTNGDKALYILQSNQWIRVWPEIVTPTSRSFLRSQSGFTSHPDGNHFIKRRGDWVYINWVFRVTRAISVPATGNIVNQTAAILNAEWRPKTWQPLHGGNESGRLWGVTLGSNGHIRLNSVGGTSNVAVNQTGQVRGWYNMEL